MLGLQKGITLLFALNYKFRLDLLLISYSLRVELLQKGETGLFCGDPLQFVTSIRGF